MLYKLETKNLYFPEIKSKEKCVELLHSVGYYNLKHFMYNEFGAPAKYSMKQTTS